MAGGRRYFRPKGSGAPPQARPPQLPQLPQPNYNHFLYSAPPNPNYGIPPLYLGSAAGVPDALTSCIAASLVPQLLGSFAPNFSTAGIVNASVRAPAAPGISDVHPIVQHPNPNHAVKSVKTLQEIERAVEDSYRKEIMDGESVSTWKIVQSALLTLNAESFESLGFHMHDIPGLKRIISKESNVNDFIHCFVAVRRIVSLHDVELAICKREGVDKFEKLGLGPLLRHPLVQHYFSVSSDTKQILKISADDIISYLSDFLVTYKGTDTSADFSKLLMEKFSVDMPEKLCIRMQGLGLYISLIREAMKTERDAYQKFLKALKHNFDEKTRNADKGRRASKFIATHKQLIDQRFRAMSERVKLFSSNNKDFKGKHIRFDSSSSEDLSDDDLEVDESEQDDNTSGVDIKSSGTKSSCPYPSAEEERERLGLNGKVNPSCNEEIEGRNLSAKKRKKDNITNSSSLTKKSSKKCTTVVTGSKVSAEETTHKRKKRSYERMDLDLPENSLQTFVTTWKDSCKEHSISEVFDRMLVFYKTSSAQEDLRKIKQLFTSYPGVVLLNTAVASMKRGMWDSLYDSFGVIDGEEITAQSKGEPMNINVEEPSLKFEGSSSIIKAPIGASADDISKLIVRYFAEHNNSLATDQISIKGIRECETWLKKQLCVENFGLLGHGELIDFLEKRMPEHGNAFVQPEPRHKNNTFSVFIGRAQLLDIFSQFDFDVSKTSTMESICMLLKNQFPFMSFQITANEFDEEFLHLLQRKTRLASRFVMYSVPLLRPSLLNGSLSQNNIVGENDSMIPETTQMVGPLGIPCSKDAMECLVRSPMLSDLRAWSHWDILYAPSLGPLLEWLSNECHNEQLSCILTRDAKLIRVDHSATIDGFLEAAVQASSFKTAVNFLSIMALYGGVNHAPISLLKCHACHAIGVILKNGVDSKKVISKLEPRPIGEILNQRKGSCLLTWDWWSDFRRNKELAESAYKPNQGIIDVARFILDFLSYLPSEFRACAADIFLCGLRSTVPDAYSMILHECLDIDQLMILHDLGFSLGIMEWIENYHAFTTSRQLSSGSYHHGFLRDTSDVHHANVSCGISSTSIDECDINVSSKIPSDSVDSFVAGACNSDCQKSGNEDTADPISSCEDNIELDAIGIVQSIRKDEFGLESDLSCVESSLLKKQHARLGRALQCLSQDLYSQDSHFLLELVQNADDNVYDKNVDPTLVFILQPSGIVVLNNEHGFTAQNIRALCDVGNSTKKGSSAGYIGHKGIGFKSVFRVTDAPEIHSNGFHVKFDVSEGQIGFILPTAIPPCNMNLLKMHVAADTQASSMSWNTCIMLPFKPLLKEADAMGSILSMFSDLHPSLLLFLHRLKCIILNNTLSNSLTIFRKKLVGNGITIVTNGEERMIWLVARSKLRVQSLRPGVHSTEIALAFTLKESSDGGFDPQLAQQPVFSFLPLRTYGFKFILQGDFVLPSAREEVDGNSPWNQWLLSEFPLLFFNAEKSFCDLPSFKDSPGRAISVYMAFVPLVGEVHGFFSNLPHLIISKLRMSNCLLLDTQGLKWVPPCRALRGWNEEVRSLLPEELLHSHLGLGYLHREITLSDPLSEALGLQTYGPNLLIDVMKSICKTENALKSLGMNWLAAWLQALHNSLLLYSSDKQNAFNSKKEAHFLNDVKLIPFLPLSHGSYSSLSEGPIWLQCDTLISGYEGDQVFKCFPNLYAKLRFLDVSIFSEGTKTFDIEETHVPVLVPLLLKIGVQRLSAHELIMIHILPSISDDGLLDKAKELMMVESITFIMLHLQSNCSACKVEKFNILSELQRKTVILTNNGFKCPSLEPVHFSKEFQNPIDMITLIEDTDFKWNEIDCIYLKHPSIQLLSPEVKKCRYFFEQLGVTDFVQINHVQAEFHPADQNDFASVRHMDPVGAVVEDWESPELVDLLSALSSKRDRNKCAHFLGTIDMVWDEFFSTKVADNFTVRSHNDKLSTTPAFVRSMHQFRWIASSADQGLYFPTDLFYNCEAVHSVLGEGAPYAVPQINNTRFVDAIGFKKQVKIEDALAVFRTWQTSQCFSASVIQMSKFYLFVWNEMPCAKEAFTELLSRPFIFAPLTGTSRSQVLPGKFLGLQEVFWEDPTGCIDLINGLGPQTAFAENSKCGPCSTLCHLYPQLHDFFLKECNVTETPKFSDYRNILKKLSVCSLPSVAANNVLQFFLRWADDIKSGVVGTEEISSLKEWLRRFENTVLPTAEDKWVSLHPDFGIVCWCDDDDLKRRFNYNIGIYDLHFTLCNSEDHKLILGKLSLFMQAIGIPALSKIMSREAIFHGLAECPEKNALIPRLLPYAQRYLYKFHPEAYISVKSSQVKDTSKLRVVTVKSLFYRNVLKGCGSSSKKRVQCSCLLDGNILYMTKAAENHSIFLEFSRFFFGGTTDLHLANFLHMVANMMESGTSHEQIESFIVGSQMVPKLPDKETAWTLELPSRPQANSAAIGTSTLQSITQTPSPLPKIQKTCGDLVWPPTGWRTPFFDVRLKGHKLDDQDALMLQEGNILREDLTIQVDDLLDLYDSATAAAVLTLNDTGIGNPTPLNDTGIGKATGVAPIKQVKGAGGSSETRDAYSGTDLVGPSSAFNDRDQLRVGNPNQQEMYRTGRAGEQAAFTHFVEKHGAAHVKWVNEGRESGLPYDLIIDKGAESLEYIEVKTTVSFKKDWFEMTPNEWQFAIEHGDAYTIARVIMCHSKQASITLLKNPLRLCQKSILKLAVLLPRNLKNSLLPTGNEERSM